jgi:hypothetical protein
MMFADEALDHAREAFGPNAYVRRQVSGTRKKPKQHFMICLKEHGTWHSIGSGRSWEAALAAAHLRMKREAALGDRT